MIFFTIFIFSASNFFAHATDSFAASCYSRIFCHRVSSFAKKFSRILHMFIMGYYHKMIRVTTLFIITYSVMKFKTFWDWLDKPFIGKSMCFYLFTIIKNFTISGMIQFSDPFPTISFIIYHYIGKKPVNYFCVYRYHGNLIPI